MAHSCEVREQRWELSCVPEDIFITIVYPASLLWDYKRISKSLWAVEDLIEEVTIGLDLETWVEVVQVVEEEAKM